MAEKSIFAALKKIFSNDVIVRNVGGKKLKIVDPSNVQYAPDANSLKDRFNRLRSSNYGIYSRDMIMSYQSARIELFRDYDCVSGDTIIPLPDGTKPTIKELAEKYKYLPQEKFYVYSYDHETDSIKLGNAFHPRSKGIKPTFKVILDNDEHIIGTEDHLFLCKNGEYKKLKELTTGESLMPFYQKDFYDKGYRHLYNFSKGWQPEHNVVAEQFYNRPVSENEVVHHKNFKPFCNFPENLQIMDKKAHRQFHMDLNNKKIWSPENYEKQCEIIREAVKKRPIYSWNGKRKGENNPFFGKKHSENSNLIRSKKLKEFSKTRNYTSEKNPNFNSNITFDLIKNFCIDFYKNNGEFITRKEIRKELSCDESIITNRLKNNNYDWNKFKKEIIYTLNHKVKSIEYYGEIEVFDISVEKYNNFATNNLFLHNCMDLDPILAAALDIFSDESLTENEFGKILSIKSDDENIKDILHNLFYDILNIEFNLWSWVRNMVKMGDFFLKLDISSEYGVFMVHPLSSYEVSRIETIDDNGNIVYKFRHDGSRGQGELENYEVAHFRLLSDTNFLPYGRSMLEGARRTWKQLCLHSNSNIWTSNGYKKIKDIEIGDIVYSYDYKTCKTIPTKVKNCLKTGNKKTYKLKTRTRELILTGEHPVLVKDVENNYSYKKAKELTKKDYIIIPTIEDNFEENKKILINNTNYCVKLNDLGINYVKNTINSVGIIKRIKDLNVNHNFKQIHAFLQGDKTLPIIIFNKIKEEFKINYSHINYHIVGSKRNSILNKDFNFVLTKEFVRFFGFMLGDGWTKNNNVSFARGIYDNKNDFYTNILKNYCESVTVKIGTKTRPNYPGSVNGYSKELSHIFNELGFKTGFQNKEIPNWVWNLSKEHKKEFIKGLFDADGSWKWGIIGLSNEKLITQYKILCQQTGIMCNEVKLCGNRSEPKTDKFGVTRQPTYKLYVNFNNEFNLDFQKVCSVDEFEENSEVWDLEVDNELHNFIANGIVVHNCLLEDAMLIHRIMRAPEKRIFKIDIGNIPASEIDGFMEKIVNQMKKVPYMDPNTGDYNLKFNINNMIEDFFLPVRGGDSGTSIDTLPGMEFTGIEDVEYVKNKMMAALKIPKTFLGYGEAVGGKSTLAQEDIRFARTITRIQKIIVSELTKIAILHLYVQGYRDASLVNFELSLSNPSTIFEQEKIAIWSDKISLAKDMMESQLISKNWIYKYIFELSDDVIEEMKEDIVKDSQEVFRYKKIAEDGEDPAKDFTKLGKENNDDGDTSGGASTEPPSDLGGGEGSNQGEEPPTPNEPTTSNSTPPPPPSNPAGGTGAPLQEEKDPRNGFRLSKDTTRKNHSGLGEDPLGKLQKVRDTKLKKDQSKNRYKNKSPLALETLTNRKVLKYNTILKEKMKRLSLLDENNILSND